MARRHGARDNDIQHNHTRHKEISCDTPISNAVIIIILFIVMLNVVLLTNGMQNVDKLNVVVLSVVAPIATT